LLFPEYFERTEGLVVPVVAGPIPVEVRKAAISGVTAVNTVGIVPEIYLSPSISSGIEYSLPCSRNTPAFF